jgi:MoaA/NifB/PqqE/SkfB family radical SAM enzyme
MLLDKERAKELVLSGLDGINISIDTTSELADHIRGVGDAYHKAYSGLNEIIQLRKTHNIRVAVGSVLMLPTLKDGSLFKIIELAEKIKVSVGIQLLDFSSFYFRGKNDKTKSELLITEEHYRELDELVDKLIAVKRNNPCLIENSIPALDYIKRYFRDPKSKDIPCYIAFSGRVWVSPVGKVFLCQSLPFVGDLRNISLKDTVSSDQWKEGIQKMFKKQCPGCSCMYASNIDAHIPLAWKEMASRKLGLTK